MLQGLYLTNLKFCLQLITIFNFYPMRRPDKKHHSEVEYQLTHGKFDGESHKALVRMGLTDHDPNQLFIVRGMRKKVGDLKKEKHPHNTIYLDGACNGPYIDARRRVYSLDHHGKRCIRDFTLSTCEQAIMLVRDRQISEIGNNIIASHADLDSLLAAWALMHADSIGYRDVVFRKMMPIFQLAGNIDRHGFGYEELVMRDEMIPEIRRRILWLSNEERELKKRQRWGNIALVEYAERTFQEIDKYAFYQDEPEEEVSIQGYDTEALPNGDTIIFVRASEGGIYGAIRKLVTEKKDNKCICVVCTDGNNKWTIKAIGLITKYNLIPVFKKLTRKETKAKKRHGVTNKKLLKTGWGGSRILGGQPRYHDGTGPFIDEATIKRVVMKELGKQI